MNTQQIHRCLKSHPATSRDFGGVFPCDKLPENIGDERPYSIVCNTDPSTKPGQHWIAMYFDRSGGSEYFCSYGTKPHQPEFVSFLQQNKLSDDSKGDYNSTCYQSSTTSVCGQYAIFYLLMRSTCISNVGELGRFLPNDQFVSDCFVAEYVNKHCRVSTDVFEDHVLIEQICVELYKRLN
jgi:hypothetical protein